MLVYELICDHSHIFEGWFHSLDVLEQQRAAGQLFCPVCGSHGVRNRPSSHVAVPSAPRSEDADTPAQAAAALPTPSDWRDAVWHWVEQHTDNVGSAFPEQARLMHEGQTPARPIRGVASPDELADLHEDGIDVVCLPERSHDKLH